MKIICQTSDLLHSINIVSRAVASNSTMDILECILIETLEDDLIKLTANDTELGIETVMEGNVVIPGKIALKARLFADMIKKLPDSELIIDTEDNGRTNIRCEDIYFGIMGQTGDDFSKIPDVEKSNRIVISQFDLKEVVRQTIFSISDNANSRLMTGELFQFKENTLTVTALDGHRISVRKLNLSEEYPDTEIIVPGKTLSEVSKILPGEADETVDIYISDKHILFAFGKTIVVSRLLEGKFYNFSQMLSADYETRVKVNKMSFLRCLDRSTLFIKDSTKRPIILKVEEDEMKLSASSQIGQMNDKLPIEKEGKEILIGFDPRYLVDALRVIDDEEINIYMINPVAPCIIKNEEGTYYYLILPINVNSGI